MAPSRGKPRPPRECAPREDPGISVYRHLDRYIQKLLAGAKIDGSGLPDRIELNLRVPVQISGKGWKRACDDFLSAISEQVGSISEQASTEVLGYRNGHVPCSWCSSPVCEHSLPSDQRAVLSSISPTGVPIWRNFASWLIEIGDPRVDRLHSSPPLPVAVFHPIADLAGDVLPEFERPPTHARILGSVLAGGFSLPRFTLEGDRSRTFSVTALLMEHHRRGPAPRYTLNLVVSLPPPHHLPSLLAHGPVPHLGGWIGFLREGLHQIEEKIATGVRTGKRISLPTIRQEILDSMRSSCDHLDKLLRRGSRRTHHAQVRSRDPDRPTASALSDVLSSRESDLFHDRREFTYVVRGPHNRVHVFSFDGTHITSVRYSGESIAERTRSGRWKALNPQEGRSFCDRVIARFSPDDAEKQKHG
ncbi:MAG TPA: hypothetical protein EYN79_08595 [Planctomycetes bacterium]|nr:hypothetical protein [Planctomycetota bacterium]